MHPCELIAATALALAAVAAQAVPCTLVFGQGRNPPTQGGPDWDGLNQSFNSAIADALDTDGRRIVPIAMSAVQVDPQAAGAALLEAADNLGCNTLIETALFQDEGGTLVLRLRTYPLLPTFGDGGVINGLRIGAPLFVTQRDLDIKALSRLRPDLIGQQMAAEYLQHDRR
jgi:hypothetical protein